MLVRFSQLSRKFNRSERFLTSLLDKLMTIVIFETF